MVRVLLYCCALVALLFSPGCADQAGSGISSRQAAVTSSASAPPITLTIYTPDAAPFAPGAQPAPPAEGPPTPPEALQKQQQYFELLKTKLEEWRAQGLSEDEMSRREGELNRSFFGKP
jgi:hypothetical protein